MVEVVRKYFEFETPEQALAFATLVNAKKYAIAACLRKHGKDYAMTAYLKEYEEEIEKMAEDLKKLTEEQLEQLRKTKVTVEDILKVIS